MPDVGVQVGGAAHGTGLEVHLVQSLVDGGDARAHFGWQIVHILVRLVPVGMSRVRGDTAHHLGAMAGRDVGRRRGVAGVVEAVVWGEARGKTVLKVGERVRGREGGVDRVVFTELGLVVARGHAAVGAEIRVARGVVFGGKGGRVVDAANGVGRSQGGDLSTTVVRANVTIRICIGWVGRVAEAGVGVHAVIV